MIFLILLAFTVLSPFFLWVYYLAVMGLKQNRANLKGLTLYAAAATLAIGYALDAYVNLVFMSLVLMELPKETTVTARLKRHYKLDGTWGKRVAVWFIPFLEPYDPGHLTG